MTASRGANENGLRARLARGAKAVGMAWRSSPSIAGAWIGAIGITAVMPIAIVWVGKAIVDSVVARDAKRAIAWVVAELLLVASMAAAQRGAALLRSLLGVRLGLTVNFEILQKTATLTLSHFQNPEFYDQLTRARREATHRPLSVAAELLALCSALATLVGFSALLFRFHPLAVILLALAAFPAALVELRFSRAAFDLRNKRVTDARLLSYLEFVLASDEHAKEVMMLGLSPTLLGRYRDVSEKLWREERGLSVRRVFWGMLLSQIGTVVFYGCYAFIVIQAALGKLGLGDMTMYALAFRQGQSTFLAILLSLGALYEHDLYMSNLLQFMAIPAPDSKLLTNSEKDRDERGIRFEDVGFRYPDQETFALRHIDLWIPAGQSFALVGHNGAGKSTFIKLLSGLYEPTEGRILLDGRDIRGIARDELRKRLSVVFQDFNQYQLTARENIAFGSVAHIDDDERIRDAVSRGGATTIVDNLPGALDTQLGRWFTGGVELSGGQWQRLALARAFMRKEADVLVLDEPTAALDIDAEAEVFERVRNLSDGKTLLLISHRFANVRMADRIVVLDKQGIREDGTHAELMEKGGMYAEMFRKQAKGYV
ncbi:MAG: ABC transporter ATP-binding protein [Polyangiaceae bacterium]|nr:ABC transporter ATP-binding protein [Polyangiaceae bacterium]